MKALALVNESNDPSIGPVLEPMASAISKQILAHYAQVWQAVGVALLVFDSEKEVPDDCDLVVILDNSDQAGTLGYHDETPSGRPYARVFWHPIRQSGGTLTEGGNSLSVTLSHECLELLGDPYATAWQDMGDGRTEEAQELCDRVEGDSYEIDGIAVSNFLAPAAFRNGPGPYDFLGLQGDPRGLKTPWEIRPGGYVIRRTGGPSGLTRTTFGAEYPDHRIAVKLAPGGKASRRGVKTS